MGLLDVLNGMQNGPRGAPQPTTGGGGGMSPMTMAILGMLAYKAYQHFSAPSAAAPSAPVPAPGNAGTNPLGPLGDLLNGRLSGNVLSNGLGGLIKDLQNTGQGQAAQSWVGNGTNQPISPGSLEAALGGDTLDALAKQTGMDRASLLDGLSQHLPGVVDHLTPDGRLPNADEAERMS
jgi:uncharacterized protein YidB (DUF937 family)